jgi:hypothetical protein
MSFGLIEMVVVAGIVLTLAIFELIAVRRSLRRTRSEIEAQTEAAKESE